MSSRNGNKDKPDSNKNDKLDQDDFPSLRNDTVPREPPVEQYEDAFRRYIESTSTATSSNVAMPGPRFPTRVMGGLTTYPSNTISFLKFVESPMLTHWPTVPATIQDQVDFIIMHETCEAAPASILEISWLTDHPSSSTSGVSWRRRGTIWCESTSKSP